MKPTYQYQGVIYQNFHVLDPQGQYATYCTRCKKQEPLDWKVRLLQNLQRGGQHPRYVCTGCKRLLKIIPVPQEKQGEQQS